MPLENVFIAPTANIRAITIRSVCLQRFCAVARRIMSTASQIGSGAGKAANCAFRLNSRVLPVLPRTHNDSTSHPDTEVARERKPRTPARTKTSSSASLGTWRVGNTQTIFDTVQAVIQNLQLQDDELPGLSEEVDWADGHWRRVVAT